MVCNLLDLVSNLENRAWSHSHVVQNVAHIGIAFTLIVELVSRLNKYKSLSTLQLTQANPYRVVI